MAAVCVSVRLCALQEVMMTLNLCHRDFAALIHRIEMERELEKCPQRRSVWAAPIFHLTVCVCVQTTWCGVGGPQNIVTIQATLQHGTTSQ